MTEETKNENDLFDEFVNLGENLKSILVNTLESDEAQKLKQEVKKGLSSLSASAMEAAEEIKTGETSSRIKDEAKNIKNRVQSGEFESKAKAEILKALQFINSELEKASDWWTSSDEAESD